MANTWMKDGFSAGYKVQSATATALTQEIDRVAGARIAIRAFGFSCGDVATSLYFLQTLNTTTVNGAVASGLVTINVTSGDVSGSVTGTTGPLTSDIDYVAITLDNGDLQFELLESVASTLIYTTNALEDTVADGNVVYALGYPGDEGHSEYLLTVSTQNTKELDGGIVYGRAKGYPMMIYHLSAGATALGSLDYLTVDYINS